MRSNFKVHEIIGIFMIFLGGTMIGLGVYFTVWGVMRAIYHNDLSFLFSAKELLVFPFFYGLGFVLYSLGQIELRDAIPGRRR